MAQSPAHAWGQIVGKVIEVGVVPLLISTANEYDLYLDSVGPRQARPGKKVTWHDKYGNKHDLDYVLERGGSEAQLGTPVGFVEVAWRRYTKHSKNKAQEIQGAILPLAETYYRESPFLGAIIAGEFTKNALTQLHSVGFQVLYFPYSDVLSAFDTVGIDAGYQENTPIHEFILKIKQWESLSDEQRNRVGVSLISNRHDNVQEFVSALRATMARLVEIVIVIPLFGDSLEFSGLDTALEYFSIEPRLTGSDSFIRVEVEVRYTNGDIVSGAFHTIHDAANFLHRISVSYEP